MDSIIKTNEATRSISQHEANEFFKEFFEKRNNIPVTFNELANVLNKELKANRNQSSGLVHRGHAKEKVLIKKGKEYSLNLGIKNSYDPPSIIEMVKLQILDFKKELDQNISLNDIQSQTEFNQLKNILKKLEELGQ
ncbi:hypothetical protein [Bacillus thuringiensis]|uniref:hypothetical protein n=1 Tax=Bacillus thuringiensis TaxID=1428 RepID=UPI003A7FCCB5